MEEGKRNIQRMTRAFETFWVDCPGLRFGEAALQFIEADVSDEEKSAYLAEDIKDQGKVWPSIASERQLEVLGGLLKDLAQSSQLGTNLAT